VKDRWAVEMAAQLSHIGFITLPSAVAEKVYYGQSLEPSELEMVAKVPVLSEQLLAHIPRLEPVREIIMAQGRLFDGSDAPWTLVRGESLPLGARILKIVIDLDALEAAGASTVQALNTLAQRAGHYDPKILETLAKAQGERVKTSQARDLPVKGLKEGMVLAEDVRMKNGTLLIARGYTVSGGLLERLKNIPDGTVKEPVRVIAGTGPEA
jgi:response regulator RpfG family c-di-GMP phosphodiesterase